MQSKPEVYLHSVFSFRLKDYLFTWKKTEGPCSLGGSSSVFPSGWWRDLRPKIRYCSEMSQLGLNYSLCMFLITLVLIPARNNGQTQPEAAKAA